MQILPRFITNWHNWLSLWKALVGAEQTHLHNYNYKDSESGAFPQTELLANNESIGPDRWRLVFFSVLHKRNSAQLHNTEVATQVSKADISKSKHMKLSAQLHAIRVC